MQSTSERTRLLNYMDSKRKMTFDELAPAMYALCATSVPSNINEAVMLYWDFFTENKNVTPQGALQWMMSAYKYPALSAGGQEHRHNMVKHLCAVANFQWISNPDENYDKIYGIEVYING